MFIIITIFFFIKKVTFKLIVLNDTNYIWLDRKKKDLFNKNLTAKEYFAAMKSSVEL